VVGEKPRVTLVFSTTSHLLSGLIRWLTKAPASHAVICVDMAGVPMIVQADVGGIEPVTRDRWLARGNRVVAEYEVLGDVDLRGAFDDFGERYDYFGLLGFFFVLPLRWLGRKIRNPLASPRAMFCSEFVLTLGLPEFIGLDPEATTPGDMMARCAASGSFVKVS
jgi:hypothetical protein